VHQLSQQRVGLREGAHPEVKGRILALLRDRITVERIIPSSAAFFHGSPSTPFSGGSNCEEGHPSSIWRSRPGRGEALLQCQSPVLVLLLRDGPLQMTNPRST
jgi:hypothetical protein